MSTPERYAPYELEVLPQAPGMGSYFTVTLTGMDMTYAPISIYHTLKLGVCRVSTPERYAPYELEVLPQAPGMGSYFTVTPTGVTQYTKGQPSEMTAMADWLHERELFSLLRSIPFFNQYILRRAYNMWKAVRTSQGLARQFAQLRQKLPA